MPNSLYAVAQRINKIRVFTTDSVELINITSNLQNLVTIILGVGDKTKKPTFEKTKEIKWLTYQNLLLKVISHFISWIYKALITNMYLKQILKKYINEGQKVDMSETDLWGV